MKRKLVVVLLFSLIPFKPCGSQASAQIVTPPAIVTQQMPVPLVQRPANWYNVLLNVIRIRPGSTVPSKARYGHRAAPLFTGKKIKKFCDSSTMNNFVAGARHILKAQ
jgi:hypothetical protein